MKKTKIYVASPLNAPTQELINTNMRACRKYCERVGEIMEGSRPLALHGVLPSILDDNTPEERDMALRWGRELLMYSDAIFVCGDRISNGMWGEIKIAFALDKQIYVARPEFRTAIIDRGFSVAYGRNITVIEDEVLQRESYSFAKEEKITPKKGGKR